MKKYNILLLDCPWDYSNNRSHRAELGGSSYPAMSLDELCRLPIYKLAHDNCVLFMWVTMPKLMEVHVLWDAWGFEYKTCAFTWIKINPTGVLDKTGKDVILRKGVYSGLGSYTNQNAELCLIGKRGTLHRVSKNVKQVVIAPRGRHSAKPAQVRERIVELYGDLPRMELFAREDDDDGWDRLGNELSSDGRDIREVLAHWDESAAG